MPEQRTEEWQTTKSCKCGNKMFVAYTMDHPHGGMTIDILNYSGEFRSRHGPTWWPNYIYCKGCGRRHALHTFERTDEKGGL